MIYTQIFIDGVGGAITAQEYEIDGGSGRIGIYYRPSTVYAYQLTDHLGNVRAVVAKSGTSLQVRLYNDFYPYGMVIPPVTVGTDDYRYGYQGQYAEKDPETDWNAFELRMYDSKIARWLSVDPKGQYHSPYISMGNNPVTGVDPDGGEKKDWVLRADNSIYWDPNANDQATTKYGETWLGKSFYIGLVSYIDKELWDGPNPWFDVSGVKMKSFIQIIGTENSKGQLIDTKVQFSNEIMTNEGGFTGVPYEGLPNLENSIKEYDKNGNLKNFSAILEKHSRVPDFEALGLVMGGFKPVDVAQRITVGYDGKNLKFNYGTGIFPSAKGILIGGGSGQIFKLMQYYQPSFRATHKVMTPIIPFLLN